jgi:DNA-binding CsgD family transcriptional regulator
MAQVFSALTHLPSDRVLVGRELEQDLLRSRLEEATEGRGSLVLLGGEAGIGKTRLVQDLSKVALAQGWLVLLGHSYTLTKGPPFSLWREVLETAREVQALPPVLERILSPDERGSSEDSQSLARQAVAYFHAFAMQWPSVLVLEDLHWADPASLDLVRVLARQASRMRLLMVATFRDDELGSNDYLYQLLPHIVRESSGSRTMLQPLAIEAVQELVERCYGPAPADATRLAQYVHELAGGNPFFMHELFHRLEEDRSLQRTDVGWRLAPLAAPLIPPLVQQIVDGRLARLNPRTLRLLATAAVAGQQFQLELCQRVSDLEASEFVDAVQEAIDSQLLVELPGTNQLRFSHEIVREVLYRRVVLPERQALHRRIAEALLQVPSRDANQLTFHLTEADDPRSVTWTIRAARQALEIHAPDSAIQLATDAMRLAERFSVVAPPEVFAIRGQAHSTIGNFEQARFDFERRLELAISTGLTDAELEASLNLGMLWAERDYGRAGEYFDRALFLARQIGNQSRVALSLNRIGNWCLNVGRTGDAMTFHREALSIAKGSGDRAVEATTLDLLGMTQMIRGDLVKAAGSYRQAADMFEALGDGQSLSSSLANLLNCTMTLATDTHVPASIDVSEFLESDGPAVRLAREIGWQAGEAYGLLVSGLFKGYRGEFGQALQSALLGLEIANRIRHAQWIAHAHWRVAILYLELLAPEEAREHLEPGLALAREIGSTIHERASVGLLAAALVQQDELEEAEQLLLGSGALRDPREATNQERFGWCTLVGLRLAQREYEQALNVVDQLIMGTPNITKRRGVAKLSLLKGEVLLAEGRLEEARAELLEARRLASRSQARSQLWRIELQLGRLHDAQGDDQRALQSHRLGRELVRDLAESLSESNLRDQFLSRALAVFPSDGDARAALQGTDAVAGLTPRELEVLRYVAQGLTDAQIAERLFLSNRTVHAHARSVRRKLGVSTRSAATRFALENDLA